MWPITGTKGNNMFTTKIQEDFIKQATEYFSVFPKTQNEVKDVLEKSKAVFEAEAKNATDLLVTCQKMATGDASLNQIALANKQAQALAVSARFAAFMAIPGAVFALPAVTKFAKEHSIDFVPASVIKEFNI